MAYVIRNGNRYRFSIPYSGERYEILRYGPVQDLDGEKNRNDLLVILIDVTNDVTIESDGEDAGILETLLASLHAGKITTDQFESELAAYVISTYQ